MAQPIWNTTAGSIGTYPSLIELAFQLSASPVLPAVSITYALISGSFPAGVSMDVDGLISGIPQLVGQNTSYSFVVRATDNYNNIRDRTFSIEVASAATPEFTTPSGSLLTTNDSTWVEFPVLYSNPIEDNVVTIKIIQGQFPPGIEMNEFGMIRGYAKPPIINVNLGSIVTASTATSGNAIFCFSTTGFTVGRPVVFGGTTFGGVSSGQTYYVHSIIDENNFTISATSGGAIYSLTDQVGYMTVTLPNISVGQPTVRTYNFTLKLESALGNDIQNYNITVVNQNASTSIGGPGLPPNTRVPTIYNTRPAVFDIATDPLNFDYYVLPPNSRGETYAPSQEAYIGQIASDNYFSFHVLGHDFDTNDIEYVFADLPLGLIGDTVTGWVTGNPIISDNTISQFSFSVAVRKTGNPAITTPNFNFSFQITNNINGEIIWITPSTIGTINNGTVSNEKVEALAAVDLQYRIVDGSLPPNLTLLSNGEISGVVAYQPTDTFLPVGETTTWNFTVEAYSPLYTVVSSQQQFTLNVYQNYGQPTDTLYIKCTPSISDRNLLDSLLDNTSIIPTEALYRPDDPYFGKATSVVYAHAYGIYASDFEEYIAAVTKNHYWRQLTLGEIKTAVARNEAGDIIYEVVYSTVVDNLINPQGKSISKEIYWPRQIPLSIGPWYTSVTNLYTSYVEAPNGQLFYTSLTPGSARLLYPNSLPNMRQQVGDVLGQEYNSNLLPKWMTSQQLNGSTTGFVPAWVIAYTLPGFAEIVKNNIENNWVDPLGNPYTLNTINFKIDRFTVDKSITFNYDKNVSPPAWTGLPSATPSPNPLDSEDFYVLFPRETILPNETQY